MQQEIWKDIPDYEGCYQVSNLGNVKSLDRIIPDGRKIRGINRKLFIDRQGYYSLTLCIYNNFKTKRVHQLVAMAFLNHIPSGYNLVVDHIDNNKLNNKVSNLRLISARENTSMSHLPSASEYVGVFKGDANNWRSAIVVNGSQIKLGTFNSEEEAYVYYRNALKCISEGREDDIKIKKHKFTSNHVGVSFDKRSNKWKSYVLTKTKRINIGSFNTETEAYEARTKFISSSL